MALGRLTALHQGQPSNISNPVLQFLNVSNRKEHQGFARDVETLEFQIDGADGSLVYPDENDPDVWAPVDTVDDRLGAGRYAATWTPGAAAAPGEWTIRWRMVETAGDDPKIFHQGFHVVDSDQPIPHAYVSVQEARDEGVPVGFSDMRIAKALKRASDYIEQVTERKFYPHFLDTELDGEGGPALQFEQPLIAVEELGFTFTTFTPADMPIAVGHIRVYNRHIRLGMTNPDDREDPRLEWLRTDVSRIPLAGYRVRFVDALSNALGFTRSQQNVRVKGMFGYTDPDGSPMGKTPDLIKLVTMRIAFMQFMRPLWATSQGPAAGPIISEKTMDQAVTYANLIGTEREGVFTGDPDVDQILANYCRPPIYGSV